jgi:hypothetical protein
MGEEDNEELNIELFSFPTVEETWVETLEIFFPALFSKECGEAFKDGVGRTPEQVFLDDNVELIFPNPAALHELLGMTVCAPTTGRSRISMNLEYVFIVGPYHSANTILHELVHAANCGQEEDKCSDERLACEIADACVPVGEDCNKQYRDCKREKLRILNKENEDETSCTSTGRSFQEMVRRVKRPRRHSGIL